MVSSTFLIFATLSISSTYVGAVPYSNLAPLFRRQNATDPFALNNAQLAQQLNLAALTAQPGDPCPEDGVSACINTGFSQCLNGQLLPPQPCGLGTQCVALPAVEEAGTVITCDTLGDAIMRITLAGATGGLTGQDNTTYMSNPTNTSVPDTNSTLPINGTSTLASVPGRIPAIPKVTQPISV